MRFVLERRSILQNGPVDSRNLHHETGALPFASAGTLIAIWYAMPERAVIERARRDAKEGKAPSTQAGEFVRQEFRDIREGKHGARSPQQAIAIGLSKARRAGVKLPPPKSGRFSGKVRRQAVRDYAKGQHPGNGHVSRRRSRAVLGALRREGHDAATTGAISRQTRAAARRRTASERSAAAYKAVHTKGRAGLAAAGRKAARTRMSH
jgi:hypothetical protein